MISNETLNSIQVSCPKCSKLYLVRTEDLSTGQARFLCKGCESVFAFNWPQPPGVFEISARLVESKDFMPAEKPPQAKAMQKCIRCQASIEVGLSECPQCGVIFEKIKRIKVAPVVPAATLEIKTLWAKVKEQYVDEKRHETFIQSCLLRDNLAFASSQYKAILEVNPHDDIASKMQNRILQLAAVAFLEAQAKKELHKGRLRLSGILIGLSLLAILLGFAVTAFKPLIAVGCSILVFIWSARFFKT